MHVHVVDWPKANELVEQVKKKKVRLNPKKFSSFINILSEFSWLEDIAELMQKKLDERTNSVNHTQECFKSSFNINFSIRECISTL